MIIAAVALAALLGAGIRAAVTDLDGSFNRQLIGTLVVNVVGAFALGALSRSGLTDSTLEVVGVGFLGALTTFSTAVAQIECIDREASRTEAIGVGVASLTVIILGAWLGTAW